MTTAAIPNDTKAQSETKANGTVATVTSETATAPPVADANALATLPPVEPGDADGAINPFASGNSLNQAWRMAQALAKSTIVPRQYQNNVPNCLIALELASRIGVSVVAVMQNTDIIHDRPSMRATFLIGTVNASRRFSPLRFRFEGKPGTPEWGCRAVARSKEDGEECIGSLVTIALAKAEGWYDRAGSKWKTMPEQMLMYRSASFWSRVYASDVVQGMGTTDEVEDYASAAELTTVPGADRPGTRMSLGGGRSRAAATAEIAIDVEAREDPKAASVAKPKPPAQADFIMATSKQRAEIVELAKKARLLDEEVADIVGRPSIEMFSRDDIEKAKAALLKIIEDKAVT